jgi:O-antigen/teichoic acid export membrane protein
MIGRYKKTKEIVVKKISHLWSHYGFRRYLKNTGWMFLGQMFSLGASFFVGAWLARYLAPENYGVLNYALSFGGIFSVLAGLGIDAILSRELVNHPEKRDELLGTSLGLKVFGGLAAILLCLFSAFIFSENNSIRLLVFIFSLSFVLQSNTILVLYFQSKVNASLSVKSQVLATIISSILKILAILLHLNVIWIMSIYVLDILWNGLFLLWFYEKSGASMKNWHFNKILAREIIKDSWFLMLASAMWFIYIRVDQLIIGNLMGIKEVGIYAVAVRLAEIWYFIPGIICGSLFPAIINAKKINESVYFGRLKKLYALMIASAIITAIPVSILARPIILWLFGQDYLQAVPILQIYIWSGIGMFLSAGVNQYLIAENMVKTSFTVNAFSMIINIILNFIFIPIMGLMGAAWASLIAYFCIPVAVWSFNNFFKNKLH